MSKLPLENQVTNLELSKKLAELKVPQESLFWWGAEIDEQPRVCTNLNHYDEENRDHIVSAFTSAELGEMLLDRIPKKTGGGYDGLQIWRCRGYSIEYHTTFESPNIRILAEHDTEANVRAKMLISLIENNLLDPSTL